jgi:hypothetical protein
MVPRTGNFRVISVFSGHRGSPRLGSFSAKCCHSVATAGFSAAPSCCQSDVYAEREYGTKDSSRGQSAHGRCQPDRPSQLVSRLTVLGQDRVAARCTHS